MEILGNLSNSLRFYGGKEKENISLFQNYYLGVINAFCDSDQAEASEFRHKQTRNYLVITALGIFYLT